MQDMRLSSSRGEAAEDGAPTNPTPPTRAVTPKLSGGLHLQVALAIAAGVALGIYNSETAVMLKPLGDVFIKLVKLVIAPVIFLTVTTGIVGTGGLGALGKTALRAMIYFFIVSTLALIVGMAAANLLHPGAGMNIDPRSLNFEAVGTDVAKVHPFSIMEFLGELVPDSFMGAFVSGNILQVLLISILFGVGLSVAGERARPVLAMLEGMTQAMFRVVDILMRLAPIGVFGAMAYTVGRFGWASLAKLVSLIGAVYLTSGLFVLLVLGAICALCGFSILRLIAHLKDELLLVLGASSSESALPSLMEKLEAAGCSRSIVGVVTPLGYSFNLDGTNIYMSLAALFIAQATNTHLSLQNQIVLLGVAMLSSKGAAGVTGAGFVTLAATLSSVPAVPVAGMALILGVDRFLSQSRALTNFIGNAVATVVVSRWRGELDIQRLREALAKRIP